MSKHIVVSVSRDRYYWPKLTIVVEARVSSVKQGQRFITKQVMAAFTRRMRGKKVGRFISVRVKDFRIVDEAGLKRLRAAAKASATVRRKRAAKRAAATRAKNRAAQARRFEPKQYFPATTDYAVN